MKGIITKPKPCCNDTSAIGLIVTFSHYVGSTHVECLGCKRIVKEPDIIDCKEGFFTNFSRVKWFNDDLDLTEKHTKEKEYATL